jgi:hypothetical protein
MRSIMAGGLRPALVVKREESARIRRILGGVALGGYSWTTLSRGAGEGARAIGAAQHLAHRSARRRADRYRQSGYALLNTDDGAGQNKAAIVNTTIVNTKPTPIMIWRMSSSR